MAAVGRILRRQTFIIINQGRIVIDIYITLLFGKSLDKDVELNDDILRVNGRSPVVMRAGQD